jgi:hypothetical protein
VNVPFKNEHQLWQPAWPAPGREKDFVVLAIFSDGDDWLAYCLPRQPESAAVSKNPITGQEEREALCPVRYTLTRTGAIGYEMIADMTTFVGEMAEELSSLYAQVSQHGMRVDCPKETCGVSNEGDARYCKECGTQIPEDDAVPPS